MSPVIRIDDDVLGELKRRAVSLDMIFEAPNTVLREVLGLEKVGTEEPGPPHKVDIVLTDADFQYAIIPLPRDRRSFFPGYKIEFDMLTDDLGVLTSHVTSAPRGTPIGDRDGGKFVQGGLRPWYDKHPELKAGARLVIEALVPGKRYRLSIARA
ncbi:MAG: hypothetical protein V3S82_00220 [Dehalococcoidia bacterium]